MVCVEMFEPPRSVAIPLTITITLTSETCEGTAGKFDIVFDQICSYTYSVLNILNQQCNIIGD